MKAWGGGRAQDRADPSGFGKRPRSRAFSSAAPPCSVATMTPAKSPRAGAARGLTEALQARFVSGLEDVSARMGHPASFAEVEWLRDGGRHGGGRRSVLGGTPIFDRASVNVSQVHYDDLPDKRLGSATALSTIIHPRHPRAPSVHAHVSWTELRDGSGYWRVMADLNPAIERPPDTARFREALRAAAGELYGRAAQQGDRYFHIPALGRRRGVAHFYLEGLSRGDFEADRALAEEVERAALDTYVALLEGSIRESGPILDADRDRQLEYHTLYFFQVLTLDRGTTSGLLVHDENDVGILGSLPSHVDRRRLEAWTPALPEPQDGLLRGLLDALPRAYPCPVGDDEKRALAAVVRRHYEAHPQALALQASGDIVPPTVDNHGPR